MKSILKTFPQNLFRAHNSEELSIIRHFSSLRISKNLFSSQENSLKVMFSDFPISNKNLCQYRRSKTHTFRLPKKINHKQQEGKGKFVFPLKNCDILIFLEQKQILLSTKKREKCVKIHKIRLLDHPVDETTTMKLFLSFFSPLIYTVAIWCINFSFTYSNSVRKWISLLYMAPNRQYHNYKMHFSIVFIFFYH